MRIAILGQGSIGRRHAALLVGQGHEVIAFDPQMPSAQPDLTGVTMASAAREALDGAMAVVVASPTSEHLEHARLALEAGAHVLIEKPLAVCPRGVPELQALAKDRGRVAAVAMNLRFHPGPLAVREATVGGRLGRVLRADAWFGSWLPGWRPGVDYRQTYSARRALGGGVLLDVIHELDLLLWLCGPARAVAAMVKKVSDLEVDVEDIAVLSVELVSGALASVRLDYLDRSYHRGLRIVGSEGTAEWRLEEGRVTIWGPQGEAESRDVPADVVGTYAAELEHFLAAIAGHAAPATTIDDGLAALRLVEASRRSAAEGVRVPVAP